MELSGRSLRADQPRLSAAGPTAPVTGSRGGAGGAGVRWEAPLFPARLRLWPPAAVGGDAWAARVQQPSQRLGTGQPCTVQEQGLLKSRRGLAQGG